MFDTLFDPEKIGGLIQKIAKVLAIAVTVILVAAGGGWILLALFDGYASVGTVLLALLAIALGIIGNLFTCMLLSAFGIMTENSAQQKKLLSKQVTLMQQMLQQEPGEAERPAAAPAPVKAPAAPKPAPRPAPKEAAAAPKSVPAPEKKPSPRPPSAREEALRILGEALGKESAEERSRYLSLCAQEAQDAMVRDVCQKAVGATEEQIIELIGTLE